MQATADEIAAVEANAADAARPSTFDELTFHPALTRRMRAFVHSDEARCRMPHVLLCGPQGGGKRTRVQCLLAELFKQVDADTGQRVSVVNTSSRWQHFVVSTSRAASAHSGALTGATSGSGGSGGGDESKTKWAQAVRGTASSASSSTSHNIFALASAYHVELTPSDLQHLDLYVVQQTFKVLASSRTLDSFRVHDTLGDTATTGVRNPPYKVIVINDADRLTPAAKAAMRRTMERHSATVRFILVARDASALTDPIVSRCVLFRVPLPDHVDMERTVQRYLDMANYTPPSRQWDKPLRQWCAALVRASDRNMTKALLTAEFVCKSKCPDRQLRRLSADTAADTRIEIDWEQGVARLCDLIVRPAPQLREVRRILNELMSHCVPARLVARALYDQMRTRHDAGVAADAAALCADFEWRTVEARAPVIHLEALVAALMQTVALRAASCRLNLGHWQRPLAPVGNMHDEDATATRWVPPPQRRPFRPPTQGSVATFTYARLDWDALYAAKSTPAAVLRSLERTV